MYIKYILFFLFNASVERKTLHVQRYQFDTPNIKFGHLVSLNVVLSLYIAKPVIILLYFFFVVENLWSSFSLHFNDNQLRKTFSSENNWDLWDWWWTAPIFEHTVTFQFELNWIECWPWFSKKKKKKATILCNICMYKSCMLNCPGGLSTEGLHMPVPFSSAYRESGCLALNLSRGGHILRLL